MIFNGEGHELLLCQLLTFRGPPGAVNNVGSLIDPVVFFLMTLTFICVSNELYETAKNQDVSTSSVI